ncbi:MAG: hypothetical protein AAF512_12555 [Pseudomonadota bacterium]
MMSLIISAFSSQRNQVFIALMLMLFGLLTVFMQYRANTQQISEEHLLIERIDQRVDEIVKVILENPPAANIWRCMARNANSTEDWQKTQLLETCLELHREQSQKRITPAATKGPETAVDFIGPGHPGQHGGDLP